MAAMQPGKVAVASTMGPSEIEVASAHNTGTSASESNTNGGATRRQSGNGLSDKLSATSGSPNAAVIAASTAASNSNVSASQKGEESLSGKLERLRIESKRAVNGAQNGGMGPIGHRGQNGQSDNRRQQNRHNSSGPKSALPNMSSGTPALSGSAAAAAAQAAALARAGSNAGSAGQGGTDSNNVSNFLFDDELDAEMHSTTYGGRYLQMNADDDKFPILVRRDSYPGILSASSAALDLASAAGARAGADAAGVPAGRTASEWPQFMPGTATPGESGRAPSSGNTPPQSGAAGRPAGASAAAASPRSRVTTGGPARSATTPITNLPSVAPTSASAASITGSAAASTTAASNAATSATASVSTGNPSSPAQMVDSLTASPKAAANGLPEQSGDVTASDEQKKRAAAQRERERIERLAAATNSINPAAHLEGHKFSDGTPSPAARYAGELAALNGTFSPYPLERLPPGTQGPYNQYGAGAGGEAYGPFGQRRQGNGGPANTNGAAGTNVPKREEPNRFAGLRLEDLQGDMAALCKDQHGCRFLQKKLEEGNAEHRDMIFAEIYPHFADLMTDSFGNYLSQKLLEHSSDEQRDALLESISGELVSISLNMHGTRAVQKMVDHLNTQRQVQSLIMALNLNVVTLIKDLNGNHVIQKCLNTLPPEDNQFIYNAVAANCIEVATHRHGCCVLQRCIDHASESQRIQLVTEITYNSLTLVLDPFGNYVVQYVLDLNDSRFITAIVNQFRNNVCALSAQKFSSNVVEKCVRVADLEGRKALISELIDRSRLERMLRDSFANYVVQTALDYAEPGQRAELVALIRPVLPMIRNTPYGKRIQSKIQREGFHDGYGRGGFGHPGMYGGMHGHHMGPGYYGMPPPGAYGPPHGQHQHPGHHHGGHAGQGSPHHGGPGQHYGQGGPGGAPQGPEAYMGRGGPYSSPYGPGGAHLPPHMASPAMSQAYAPGFGSPAGGPIEGAYAQAGPYPYL